MYVEGWAIRGAQRDARRSTTRQHDIAQHRESWAWHRGRAQHRESTTEPNTEKVEQGIAAEPSTEKVEQGIAAEPNTERVEQCKRTRQCCQQDRDYNR
jgi:hypothetical protein